MVVEVAQTVVLWFSGELAGLVYSSTGNASIFAVPASICWAYSLVQSLLISVHKGATVNMVLAAWKKCFQCCWRTSNLISLGSYTVVHVGSVDSSLVGILT